MIVVLTGAPGAGKGTQADILEAELGYRKVSTGDALRKHIKAGTEVGKVAKDIIEAGNLVPDDVLFEVLKEELGGKSDEKILLDGYPRNVNQAKTLKTLADVHPVKAAIHLDVPTSSLIERLSGRRVCSQCGRSCHVIYDAPKQEGVCDHCGGALAQRPDDAEEKVKVRLNVYEQETKPILDFYQAEGLYQRLDGSGAQQQVFAELREIVAAVS